MDKVNKIYTAQEIVRQEFERRQTLDLELSRLKRDHNLQVSSDFEQNPDSITVYTPSALDKARKMADIYFAITSKDLTILEKF